jgi:hypothetical protein
MRWRLTVILACLVFAQFLNTVYTKAAPASDPLGLGVPDMTVVVVRSTKPGCEPLCPEWISAEGTITMNAVKKFNRVLQQVGSLKLPVVLQSPGGDIGAAIAIGKMIRQHGLDVGIGVTQFEGCAPSDKNCHQTTAQKNIFRGTARDETAYCFSACPLILAGGVARVAGPATRLGVHQPITKQTMRILKYEIRYRMVKGKKHILSKKLIGETKGKTRVQVGMNKAIRAMLVPYLNKMGISLQLLAEMDKAPPSSIYQPGIVKNDELGLTTNRFTLLALIGNSNCSPPKPAANCVALPK